MNRLDLDTRARMISCMTEGMGVRPTARVVGVSVNAVQRLIRSAGAACQRFHDEQVRNLPCKKIQADEVWCFVGARDKHVRPERRAQEWGDAWVWATLCNDTKIVPAWFVGPRTQESATVIVRELFNRITGRFELNTDGLRAYQTGIVCGLADQPRNRQIDYARVIKTYATPNGRWNDKGNRYEQPQISAISKERVCGNPDTDAASTSYIERLNLGLRMATRKMARLTNGHAKKVEMLEHSLALTYTFYNFCKQHQTLGGRTPAMAAGIIDRRLTAADLAAL